MTMKSRSPSVPTSYTATTRGWLIAAAARASDLEARLQGVIPLLRGIEEFDGDLAMKPLVERTVYNGHAAAAEPLPQRVTVRQQGQGSLAGSRTTASDHRPLIPRSTPRGSSAGTVSRPRSRRPKPDCPPNEPLGGEQRGVGDTGELVREADRHQQQDAHVEAPCGDGPNPARDRTQERERRTELDRQGEPANGAKAMRRPTPTRRSATCSPQRSLANVVEHDLITEHVARQPSEARAPELGDVHDGVGRGRSGCS